MEWLLQQCEEVLALGIEELLATAKAESLAVDLENYGACSGVLDLKVVSLRNIFSTRCQD